jgi:hypothetical protein
VGAGPPGCGRNTACSAHLKLLLRKGDMHGGDVDVVLREKVRRESEARAVKVVKGTACVGTAWVEPWWEDRRRACVGGTDKRWCGG